MTLRVFNPEHDIALGFGQANFTAPLMAQRLHRDLQMLPAWIASDGDSVLSADASADAEWLLGHPLLGKIKAAGKGELRHATHIEPWGWDKAIAHRLLLDGAPVAAVPDENKLNSLAALSHRRTCLKLALSPQQAQELSSPGDVAKYVAANPNCYLKAPWSSSGRGVLHITPQLKRSYAKWADATIAKQGSIIAEPAYDCRLNFAVEYMCSGGNAKQVGYSVFTNDSQCSFDTGIVGSNSYLSSLIVEALDGDHAQLDESCSRALEAMNVHIAPHYCGYAGMDMMVYVDPSGKPRINACIELNLRQTMGVVTCLIAERYVAHGSNGTFHIEFFKDKDSNGTLCSRAQDLAQKHPLVLQADGRIVAGYVPLCPIYPTTQYLGYMILKSTSGGDQAKI